MNNHKAFWFHSKMPQGYHNEINSGASGVVDEKIIAEYIKTYIPSQEKVLVDLGIGTGRELPWLDNLKGVSKIIGVDYSPAMIRFCQKVAQECKHQVELYTDDLFKPKYFKKIASENSGPTIYFSLINTFGNFSKDQRILTLKNVCELMKSPDRIIIAVYKRSQHAKLEKQIKNRQYITVNEEDRPILAEIIEYGGYSFLWDAVLDKYNQLPQFWYDKENHDLAIHINGKRLFTSHRFAEGEAESEFRKAGLEIEQTIEGRAMWIVVGKK